MKEEPVDPRLEKLVASLYNELSEEEERALRLEIAADPKLAAEWEELRGTRNLFGTLAVEEEVPSFVLVDPVENVRSRPRRAESRFRLADLWTWGGWAVAAAAVLVLLFGAGGLHVQKLENGFAFRFGSEKDEPVAPDLTSPPVEEKSTQFVLQEKLPQTTTPKNVAEPVTTKSGVPYLTQAEFDARSSEMMKMVVALVNDHRSRRDQELAAMMQVVYGQLNDRQLADYRELRGRIEAVGLGLRAEQTRTHAFIEDLLDEAGGDSTVSPATEDRK